MDFSHLQNSEEDNNKGTNSETHSKGFFNLDAGNPKTPTSQAT